MPDTSPFISNGKDKPDNKISVVINIPENINERIRRQKINRIYDILSKQT